MRIEFLNLLNSAKMYMQNNPEIMRISFESPEPPDEV